MLLAPVPDIPTFLNLSRLDLGLRRLLAQGVLTNDTVGDLLSQLQGPRDEQGHTHGPMDPEPGLGKVGLESSPSTGAQRP